MSAQSPNRREGTFMIKPPLRKISSIWGLTRAAAFAVVDGPFPKSGSLYKTD